MTKLRKYLATLVAGASMLFASAAMAEYPEKPVTLVVPWPAGSSADLAMRILANLTSEDLGQKIVVRNIAGAAGTIGTLHVKNAAADGYTILNNWVAPHVVGPMFNPDIGYGSGDFEPIVASLRLPFTITVAGNHPANNLKEFVAWVHKLDRPINISTCTAVSVPRMVVEETLQTAGIAKYNSVSYEGCMPDAMKDLISGNLDAATGIIAATKVFGDKVKHIAIMSEKRESLAPDVPTSAEQGYDIGWGMSGQGWAGLAVVKGTDHAIVNKLVSVFGKWVRSDVYKKKMTAMNFSTMYMGPEAFGALWQSSQVNLKPAVDRLLAKSANN